MRRLVLLSLTAAGVLATAAVAQEQPAPADAAPAPAEAAPAPAEAAPAEAAPAPVAEQPAPPPAAPTDITSLTALNLIDKVCMPLVRGGDIAQLAPAAGFKKKRDVWVLAYTKGYQITLLPQGVNKDICTLEIDHPIDSVAPAATLATDLHNWARGRGWYLKRFDKITSDMERTTRTWETEADVQLETLVLMTERKADGSPVKAKADHSELLYSVPAQH